MNKKNFKVRFARIEGQIKGINRMIDEDRDCVSIFQQFSAVNNAMKGIAKEIILENVKNGDLDDEKLSKVLSLLVNL